MTFERKFSQFRRNPELQTSEIIFEEGESGGFPNYHSFHTSIEVSDELQRCYSEIASLENIVRAQLHGIKYYQWLNDKNLEVDDDVCTKI